jgi:MFS family permease
MFAEHMTSTPVTAGTPRALDRDHRATTLGLLALVTMFAFEAVAVSLAMPRVAHALDGETLYPIAVIGMLTAAIVGMVVGGTWADARGPGLSLLVGGLGFTGGLLLSGFATSMDEFVLGRLVQGLGSGLALTSMYVAVGDAYPANLRPRVFSLFATAWVLPSIVGPFVAGALVDLLGWRSVFLVVAAFALLSTFFVRITLRAHLLVRDAPLVWGRKPAYATVTAVGAVALHVAGQADGVGRVLLLVAGVAMLALTLPPLLPRGTLRARPGLPATVAARGVFGASFACLEMFIPLVLQDESGLSPTLTGLVMMTGALGWVSGSAYTGRSATHERYGAILRLGSLSLVVGSAASLAMVPFQTQPWLASAAATIGITVMGFGMGLVTPLLSTLALDLAEPGRQGESGAAIQMSDSLGQSVAAGLVGALFASWYVADRSTSYFSGLGLAVVLAVGAVAIVGRAVPD